MTIREALSAVNSFETLQQILLDADVKVSFWGMHSVVVTGYEKSCTIDNIVRVAMSLSHPKSLDKREIAYGPSILRLIDGLHELNKRRVKERNYLTQLFCKIISIVPCWGANKEWNGFAFRIFFQSDLGLPVSD